MNKTCARCEKTVYPTEELKCLDKVWHKGCFKCQECGMTLNMRTYKGYGKLPYCESHVPKAKHTTMAETPELKRIAENTKIQSNVKYHADFEKSKGKFTQVADDPETLRIKANTRIISNVAYHGDLEKKAHMERQRLINENGEIVELPSTDNYHQQIESYATEMLPPNVPTPNLPPKNHYQTLNTQQINHQPINNQPQINHQPINNQPQVNHQPINNQPQVNHQPTNNQPQINHHQQLNNSHQQLAHQQQQLAQQQHNRQHLEQQARQQYAHEQQQQQQQQYYRQPQQQIAQQQKYDDNHSYQNYDEYQGQYTYGQYPQPNYGGGGQQRIGRIQDYDPLSDGPRPAPDTPRAAATLIYNSTHDKRAAVGRQQVSQSARVSDLDPTPRAAPPAQPTPQQHINQRVYIAMYDYQANDSDEVSFREGDLISNVTSIDDGWMTGQVIRTGHTGMLPANYVEIAPAGSIPGYY